MSPRWYVLSAVLLVSGCPKPTGPKQEQCPAEACSGHGHCEVEGGRPRCECDEYYVAVGLQCAVNCLEIDCSNRGGCVVTGNEPECICDQGYWPLSPDEGLGCKAEAPGSCAGQGCSGRGVCVEEGGPPYCICNQGWYSFGLSCVEGTCTGVECSGHGACVVDDVGAPECRCDPGYQAAGLGCVPSDCSLTDCSGNGGCVDDGGEARCVCDHGHVAVGLECRPEACASEACSGHGACVEEGGSLRCVCDPGYVADGMSCRPGCRELDCSGHGACVQSGGELRCVCDPGYVAEGQSCVAAVVRDGGVESGVDSGSADSGGVLDSGLGDGGDGAVAVDGGGPDSTVGDSSADGGDDGGPTALEWVPIVGGTFDMGDDSSAYADEKPAHSVTVPSFEMLRTEFTVSQYGECVTAGSCTEPGTGTNANWNDPGYEDHPVNYIDWQQAVDFCTWAGGRLPSEAEWEYAARSGGLDQTYPWGNDPVSCTYAVMYEGSNGCGTGRTWAVCSKEAGNTAQGLCDMAGNTWEWVQDWYHSNYAGAPIDGSAWETPSGTSRVFRGGSFYYAAGNLRAADRGGGGPGNRFDFVGARCGR